MRYTQWYRKADNGWIDSRIALALAIVAVAGLMIVSFIAHGSLANSDGKHPHKDLDCSGCHKMTASLTTEENLSAMPQPEDCLTCHRESRLQRGALGRFHSAGGSDCLSCHSFHEPDNLIISEYQGSLKSAQGSIALCLDCHTDSETPEVSPGHRLAAELIHSDAAGVYADDPSQFCLDCHNRKGSLPFAAEELGGMPRFHVEASHLFGVEITPGYKRPASTLKLVDEFPANLRLIDGKMECQTCHSIRSDRQFLLTKTISEGLCTDCHDMQPESAPDFAVSHD